MGGPRSLSNSVRASSFRTVRGLFFFGDLNGRLGASRDPCQRFRGDKYAAVIVEWSLSIESLTR
jgi:hypothetical protein